MITHLSETVKIKKVSEDEKKGVFHIEGLYTGYGLTIGNALRRALLSSLPGAAVTQIKIKGVQHEFSTLPGMSENIVDFTLNLKKIRFQCFVDEPQVLTLKVKGAKEITAGDIETNANVKIINPDLYLAVLTDKKADLDMEITVERGLGYVPAESRKVERLPIGTIVLDAIFSPVTKVNFKVENMRVGERTDYNRIILDVETDGSISPSAALHKSANVLSDHFAKVSAVEVLKTEEIEEKKPKKKSKK